MHDNFEDHISAETQNHILLYFYLSAARELKKIHDHFIDILWNPTKLLQHPLL